MNAYTVTLTRLVEETATVTIHADTPSEAERMGQREARSPICAWAKGDVVSVEASAELIRDPELEARKEAAHDRECREAAIGFLAEQRRKGRRLTCS